MPCAQYYLFALLALIPLIQIFKKAGLAPYWILLLATPYAGLVLCTAILAFKKWPQGT
ncbi:MAG: hypothetical protein HY052_09575 [Proteobacteria bacterium]|nr:hypothetical protein [Pseudomonadota bacterium]